MGTEPVIVSGAPLTLKSTTRKNKPPFALSTQKTSAPVTPVYFQLGISFGHSGTAHVDESGLAYQTRATAAVMILLVWDDVGMAFLTLALSSGDKVVGPPMLTDGCGRRCSGGLEDGAESDVKRTEPRPQDDGYVGVALP